MAWGGNIRSVSRFDPLLASKTTGVDDEQLYFHVDQHNTEPYRRGLVYRMELWE